MGYHHYYECLTLANNLRACEGKARIFKGLTEESEVNLATEWEKRVANAKDAVPSWATIEDRTVVKRGKLLELGQSQSDFSEREHDLALKSTDRLGQYVICGLLGASPPSAVAHIPAL